MSRLCGLRVEFERLSEKVLTEQASEVYDQLLQERRQRLAERYTSQFNTQSYDKVYFYERVQTWNSRTISSSMDSCPVVHSPLAELQMAQVGYQTARTKRFYNRLHRETIANASLKASQVLTTDGTSASSTVAGQMSDGVGYVRIKSKKLMKKLSQVFLNRTAFESKEYSPDEELLLRIGETQLAQDAFEALREAELIRADVKFEEVPRRFKESSLVLGWTLNHLR